MVDWDRVERLRSRGWDWDRIAGDEKVDFHAEEGAGEPGRALRAIYYQRRSRQQRRPGEGGKGAGGGKDLEDKPRWTLARAGFVVTPLFAIWFVLAYFYPSPVGVYISAVPLLAIFLFAGAAVLAFGLLRSSERWSTTHRNALIMGVVLGLVVSGGFGLAAIAEGCPNLTPATVAEPNSWLKANNNPWQDNGAPVMYFYGAYACPYCAATAWAVYYATTRLGSVTNVQGTYSSPDDLYKSTPTVRVDELSVQSQWVSLKSTENHDPTNTIGITPAGCTLQAYVSAYDTGGIPFLVINGQYVHTGTIVNQPGANGFTLNEYTFAQIMGNLNNQSGPAWDIVSTAAYWLLAFLVKANNGNPANVAAIPEVQTDLQQIT